MKSQKSNLIIIFLTFCYFLSTPPLYAHTSKKWLCCQERKDLKKELIKRIKHANSHIYLSIYALSDPQIIKALNKQAAQKDLKICIWTDKKHLKSVQKKLSPKIECVSRKQKGLMHHKIFIVDQTCFLGSSNLTSTSLRMHDNLTLQLQHFPFTYTLTQALSNHSQKFTLETSDLKLYLLPHSKALKDLIDAIEKAQKEIHVAQFTFTHKLLAEKLIEAKKRGVKVHILIDRLSIKGASRFIVDLFQHHQIKVYCNRSQGLMHHKMCLIDHQVLFFGSCNWTLSAFKKNHDFIVKSTLNPKDQKSISALFKHLFWEAKEVIKK